MPMSSLLRSAQRTEAHQRVACRSVCEVESSHFGPLVDPAHGHARGGGRVFGSDQARVGGASVTPSALCAPRPNHGKLVSFDSYFRCLLRSRRSDCGFLFSHRAPYSFSAPIESW